MKWVVLIESENRMSLAENPNQWKDRTTRCANYEECGNSHRDNNAWCDSCGTGYSVEDKWYLIGFYDLWPITISRSSYVEKAWVRYDQGVADRLGDEDVT